VTMNGQAPCGGTPVASYAARAARAVVKVEPRGEKRVARCPVEIAASSASVVVVVASASATARGRGNGGGVGGGDDAGVCGDWPDK